jgi:hypothetical protein
MVSLLLDLLKDIVSFLNKYQPLLQQLESLVVIFGVPAALIGWFFNRLELKFVPKETYHEVLEVGRQKMSLWLHLVCKNNGWAEAKQTSGFLTKVYNLDSETNNYILDESFRSQIILKWAHEDNYNPYNILPRNKRRLDVCYIYEDDESDLFFSTPYYPSGTARKLNPGRFLLEIVVTGENVKIPAQYLLGVFWDGKWKGLKGERLSLKSFKIYRSLPIKSFKVY